VTSPLQAATADDVKTEVATADDVKIEVAVADIANDFDPISIHITKANLKKAYSTHPTLIRKDWLSVKSVTFQNVVHFFEILSGALDITKVSSQRGWKWESLLWCAIHYGVDPLKISPSIYELVDTERKAGAEAPPVLSELGIVLENPNTHCTNLGEPSAPLDASKCCTRKVDVHFAKDGTSKSQILAAACFSPSYTYSDVLMYSAVMEPYKRCAKEPHSRLVEILYDVFSEDGLVTYMYPWKDTLAKCSEKASLDPPTKLQMILDILTGISTLHAADIFNGSLPPDNICLYSPADDPDQQGLIPGAKYRARIANSFEHILCELSYIDTWQADSLNYTAPESDVLKEAFGTPEYILARKRCDVYSVCVIIYEILTGRAFYPSDLNSAEVHKKAQREKVIEKVRKAKDEARHKEKEASDSKNEFEINEKKAIQEAMERGLSEYQAREEVTINTRVAREDVARKTEMAAEARAKADRWEAMGEARAIKEAVIMDIRGDLPLGWPEKLKDIMSRGLYPNPQDRPSIRELFDYFNSKPFCLFLQS
jgi:hypothetical protein